MSEERSYYEIALTNRQVAFAIGTLLLCVVGAFVAGLWVAREALGGGVVAGPEVAQNSGGEEPFDFFGDAPKEPASDVAPADAPQIPVQRVRTDEPEAETPATAPPRDEEPAPRPEPSREEPQRDEPEPEAPETVEQDPAPARVVAADPPSQRAASSDAAGGAVIQVFSSADEGQANALLGRLRDAGYQSFLDPLDNGTRTMYRVRVGPYGSRPEAETAADELRRQFRLETWITSN